MENQKKRRIAYISLRMKLLLVFTILFSVVFVSAYVWFFNFATDVALSRIEEDMIATLQGAAAGLDVEEMLALAAEGQVNADSFSDDPRYWNQVDWMDQVHSIEPRAWPYTYLRGEAENEVIFVSDLFARYDPERATKFLEPYTSIGPLIRGLDALTTFMEPYEDPWGNWVSAYIPLTTADGESVGGLGLDFRAEYVFEVQQGIRDRLVLAFLITYSMIFVIVFLVSRLMRPISILTRIAERIGEGDYDQNLAPLSNTHFPDEISKLAEVFAIMVGKVSQRETKLKQQVAQLKIEIDEVERKKQVAKITESEYFQELQEKAREMREGKKTPSASEPAPEG